MVLSRNCICGFQVCTHSKQIYSNRITNPFSICFNFTFSFISLTLTRLDEWPPAGFSPVAVTQPFGQQAASWRASAEEQYWVGG